MDTIETIKYKGYTIQIEYDTDSNSPREWDNLGTMCLFHRHRNLPNESSLSMEEAQGLDHRTNLILPVYGYEHGGLSISTGKFFHNWDSGQLGVIYVSHERIKQEYKDVPFEEALEKAKGILENEVKIYNQYLTGEVFAYVTLDKLGEIVDSCCGFYDMEGCVNRAKDAIDSIVERKVLVVLDMVTDEGWQVRDRKYMGRGEAEELVRKNPKIYRTEEN